MLKIMIVLILCLAGMYLIFLDYLFLGCFILLLGFVSIKINIIGGTVFFDGNGIIGNDCNSSGGDDGGCSGGD